jgi:hypothetical protein
VLQSSKLTEDGPGTGTEGAAGEGGLRLRSTLEERDEASPMEHHTAALAILGELGLRLSRKGLGHGAQGREAGLPPPRCSRIPPRCSRDGSSGSQSSLFHVRAIRTTLPHLAGAEGTLGSRTGSDLSVLGAPPESVHPNPHEESSPFPPRHAGATPTTHSASQGLTDLLGWLAGTTASSSFGWRDWLMPPVCRT